MPRTGQAAVRRVAAVERALAVLDALSGATGELGTNELARRTGINASTVSRLLATLAASGLVEHVPATGRYRLGLRLLQLGNSVLARLDLREVARPHLHALVAATGETATLSAPGERDAVTVDFVESEASIQSVARLGRPSIGHATATGKVLLAFGRAELPAGALKAYTTRTITDRRKLAAEVDRVYRLGYADAVGERELDLNAIAAPVFGAGDELAAIVGELGPSSRLGRDAMGDALDPLLAHVRRPGVQVGDERDAQAVERARQARQPERDLDRLDVEPSAGEAPCERRRGRGQRHAASDARHRLSAGDRPAHRDFMHVSMDLSGRATATATAGSPAGASSRRGARKRRSSRRTPTPASR